MEQRRFILLLVFAFSLIMLWQGWMEQNRPPAPPPGSVASESVPGAPAPAQPRAVNDPWRGR